MENAKIEKFKCEILGNKTVRAFLQNRAHPRTQITQNQILVSVLMHVLETVFKVVGGAFLLLHPKSFYTNNENHLNSEKNGSIGKKLSLFYNNPSIIADQCHKSNLLEQEFQYQKKMCLYNYHNTH